MNAQGLESYLNRLAQSHAVPVLAGITVLCMVLFAAFERELRAATERDPAATSRWLVFFTYAGFHAILFYRLANFIYRFKVPFLPRVISQTARFLTGIEIHPGATIGRGLFIDHGMGVVIGETTIIGDDVTLYQGVTLGGTGKERGKRHPTLGNHVVVGTGAKVLGDIKIGDHVFVGANAVVLRPVPAHATVVGVPGRIASIEGRKQPSSTFDQSHLPDPLARALDKLQQEITALENEIKEHRKKKD